MQKGQSGTYRTKNGDVHYGVVAIRVRGANQVDIDDHRTGKVEQINIGVGPGLFEPHGYHPEDAPPPALPARLVPRYIPTWHAVVLGIPVAAAVSVVTNLIWNWLSR